MDDFLWLESNALSFVQCFNTVGCLTKGRVVRTFSDYPGRFCCGGSDAAGMKNAVLVKLCDMTCLSVYVCVRAASEVVGCDGGLGQEV